MNDKKKCIICGTEFIDNTYNSAKKYCSKRCRDVPKAKHDREYMRKRRHILHILGQPSRLLGTQLSDTRIIEFKGKKRIRSMVIIERLIKSGRVNR